jgi:hypothetical protein
MRYRDCENCGYEIDAREVVETCHHCKKNINKPKTKTMNNFKEKDKVFVYPYGWCELVAIYIDENWCIKHKNQKIEVHKDLISFTEYTLEGFTQQRPFEPVVGQMYYFWDDNMLDQKRVICAFYKGYGSVDFPYSVQDASVSINFQHISETNPLL